MLPFTGSLEPYNDGHIPETFRSQSSLNLSGDDCGIPKIVNYNNGTAHQVHVYDGVLHPNHARMLYDVTADSGIRESCKSCENTQRRCINVHGESPWGTYVSTQEALDWIQWKTSTECNKADSTEINKCCISSSYNSYQTMWKDDYDNFCKWHKQRQGMESNGEETKEDATVEHVLSDNMDSVRHALAVEAVARFFLQTIPNRKGHTSIALDSEPHSTHETLYELKNFLQNAHGVAVWALSSRPGQSVQYHIDYAELLRYEYNVTVPPLWAGTIQCSELCNDTSTGNRADVCDGIHECCGHCRGVFKPSKSTIYSPEIGDHPHRQVRCCFDGIHECSSICGKPENTTILTPHNNCFFMRGGEFCVNIRGLQHYSEHGYKGNISGDAFGGWTRPIKNSSNVFMDNTTKWVTIPYAFNRGICHSGDLPHLSAPIEHIGPANMGRSSNQQLSESTPTRVILGFNVFGHDVGDIIAKAPEHSKTFRRKVKLYRACSSERALSNDNPSNANLNKTNAQKTGLDISQITQNKALSKLLVLAKRERVKEELRRQQEQLSIDIWTRLLEREKGKDLTNLRIADIIVDLSNTDVDSDGRISWPRSDDVHAHLNRMLFLAQETFHDVGGIAGYPGAYYKLVVTHDVTADASPYDGTKCSLISPSAILNIARCA